MKRDVLAEGSASPSSPLSYFIEGIDKIYRKKETESEMDLETIEEILSRWMVGWCGGSAGKDACLPQT